MIYSLLFIAVVVHKAESDWNRYELTINRSVKIDVSTQLVLMGTRHGNRLPSRFIDINQRTWGFEGNAELTQFGKRQSFGVGKELREFVGSMISKNYSPKEAKFYTSSANRCQMTLQTLLAGFYRPDTFTEWNPALDWTPVPYSIDDRMLRMNAVKNCPRSDDAWMPILNDTLTDLILLSEENRLLLDYIANNSGWNASINSASDVADNLIEIDLYGAKYPDWIDNPLLDGYDSERLKKEILAFTEKHQIRCTEYEPCRNMMSGVWLHNIITTLEKAQRQENTAKLIVFVSHTEIILSVIKLMHFSRNDLPTSAGFLVEYRNKPISSVRLLSHEPVAIDDHLIYQADYEKPLAEIADSKYWIPLDKFIALVRKNAISNWEQACDRQSAMCITQRISSNAHIMSSSFICFSLTAFITLICF